MKLWDNIKTLSFEKNLKKLSAKSVNFHQKNWSEIRTIGLIFNADTEDVIEEINNFSRFLFNIEKEPSVIGYIDTFNQKLVPVSRTGFNYISNVDLTAKSLSESSDVIRFINKEFDLLIDLNILSKKNLILISKYSHALYKVGIETQKVHHLNFSIQMDDLTCNKANIQKIIETLKHYLPLLHT